MTPLASFLFVLYLAQGLSALPELRALVGGTLGGGPVQRHLDALRGVLELGLLGRGGVRALEADAVGVGLRRRPRLPGHGGG